WREADHRNLAARAAGGVRGSHDPSRCRARVAESTELRTLHLSRQAIASCGSRSAVVAERLSRPGGTSPRAAGVPRGPVMTPEPADAPALSVVMPVYNEEQSVGDVLAEWTSALDALGITYEFLVLDDGSRDRTGEVVREMAARSKA